jgi:heat shock protein 5
LATIADARLGGNDFDQRVAEHFFQLYKSYTGIDASSNLTSITKMLREVERAKQVISEQMHSTLEVIEFYGDEHFSEVLTRPMFERLNMELFEKSMGYVEQVLKDANLTRENITEVRRSCSSSLRPIE